MVALLTPGLLIALASAYARLLCLRENFLAYM